MQSVLGLEKFPQIKTLSLLGGERLAVYDNGLIHRLDYHGDISDRQIKSIIRHYSVFEWAADQAELDWQMVAAVYYVDNSQKLGPQKRDDFVLQIRKIAYDIQTSLDGLIEDQGEKFCQYFPQASHFYKELHEAFRR